MLIPPISLLQFSFILDKFLFIILRTEFVFKPPLPWSLLPLFKNGLGIEHEKTMQDLHHQETHKP